MKAIPRLAVGLALVVASVAKAGFTPIALNPASYNHDVIVEAAAPKSLNDAVTATMDGGTNKTGNTWYERGYNPAAATTGLPVAGSFVTNAALNHIFRMAPDYTVNNVFMVGRGNGAQTVNLQTNTVTFTTPTAFTGLSFLTASGGGPAGGIVFGYTIHYADLSTENGTFTALDWFNAAANVFNAAGRVSLAGGVQNVGANPAGAVFAADVGVGNPAQNIVSIELYSLMNFNVNGRAVVFAVSGAKDSSTDYTNTIAVTGYNQDAVVEAGAAPTTGSGVPAGSALTNNITASMDGGTSKAGSVWYEAGYYTGFPGTGIPAAGSTFTSAANAASYTMPASYVGPCAIALGSNVTSANIIPATPAAYGGLSFLCAVANGDTFLPVTIKFQDGSSENNTIFVPDWFNRVIPPAYHAFGRANANNRTVNSTPDQFVSPFLSPPLPFAFDYRGLTLPGAYLFDAVVNVTNTQPITNITVNFTNNVAGISTRFASILAVSGAPVGNVPPVLGSAGTPTPGQPNGAVRNAITMIKRWEGSNSFVLAVTNIAGTGPISYQWKRAPRGGGFGNILYSFDNSTFADVSDNARVIGSSSRTLTLTNPSVAESGDYLVVASNPYGSVTSLPTTVQIFTTNQSILIGQPAGDVIAPIAGDAMPVAESIDHVIDRAAQKWLSSGLQQGGPCCGGTLPYTGPVGFSVIPVSGGSIVTSMRFFTANDSQGRDPWDYTLEGSNDGSTWSPIAGGALKGTLTLPTTRNGTGSAALDVLTNAVTEVDFPNAAGYKSYRVSITNVIDRYRNSLMQIAEIELLGTFLPAPPTWVRQPEPSVQVYVGASPVFGVQASGLGSLAPRYQWYRNGTTLIPGATNKTYTLPNAQLVDTGATFSCVATNPFGTITSTACTLSVIAAPAESYPSSVLANNPIGFWRLNEGPDNGAGNQGLVTHDYRGGHNGYYSNVTVQIDGYSPASDPDKAADFGGINNAYVADIKDVDFARAPNTAGASFSVEAWVYGIAQTVDAAIVAKGYNGILNAGTGTGTEQFALDLTGTPRKFRFLVRDAAGNGHAAQSAVPPNDTNSLNPAALWHHLLGVCDQPNGKVYLYVDGVLGATGDIATNAGILTQPLAMTIGSRKSGGATDYDNSWLGHIDDVAVYGTALNASQALAHLYAAQRPPIITLQPTNQTTPDNVPVTFNSAAYGPGTLSYQWYLSDGLNPTTAVAGQTAQNLAFVTSPAVNNNSYQLIVTNQYGGSTGVVATLTVVSGAPIFFTDLPASDTFLVGHVMQLRVVPGGTGPFTYQWQKDNVNIVDDYRTSGSQTPTLTIGYAVISDSGNYKCIVTGTQGTTPSTVDAVSVINQGSAAAPFTAAGTGWSLQGVTNNTVVSPPVMGANRLEITSAGGGTARSAFLTSPLSCVSFNAAFVYTLASAPAAGADGITFCIQNAAAGAAANGTPGGGLGYGGITPSVALAMNIYDPNTRGIGFLQNGALPAAGAGAYSPIAPVLLGGNANPIQVNVSYAGGVLTSTFKDLVTSSTFTTNRTVDIPGIVGTSSAYFGFTGADGGVVSTQVISNFVVTPPPVTLKMTKSGSNLILSWPASSGAILRSTSSLTSPVTWTDALDPFAVVGTEARVTVTPASGARFFRLDVYP